MSYDRVIPIVDITAKLLSASITTMIDHKIQKPKIGVLLVNLGTPDKPTAFSVMRYLRQFLSDRRV